MVFNSIEFLIFFPAVLLLYFLLPKKTVWLMLLAASYYFYLSWNASLVFLIVFTTAVSYLSGIIICKTEKKGVKRLFLVLTLVACLGVLFFYKYFNFISSSLTFILHLFGSARQTPILDLILPVGISFYTFQTLSYVIDCYRGSIKSEKHFGYYALFVSFFPQLVAGPIERPENLLPQLKTVNKFSAANLSAGLKLMLVGFFKKLVCADMLSGFVTRVYNSEAEQTGLAVVIATVLFAVQIYCDFSGYTDIAIGCAKTMGISLMQNFNAPYSARSIREFWQRWHISLSSWLRDYLYIPLGGSRVPVPRYLFNIMVVFLLSGLWHGASWTFVIWGMLHGLYQVIGYITKKPREKLRAALHIHEGKLLALWQRACTFALVCFAWIFFRAQSFASLGRLLRSLFTGWGGSDYFAESFAQIGMSLYQALTVLLTVILLVLLDRELALKRGEDIPLCEGAMLFERSRGYILIIWAVAVTWMRLAETGEVSTFIYFQF